MTATYNPAEVERLIETVRRIANIKRPPCADCSCWSCADCHCSLEHARRDREIAMADQLEAARARIVELERAIERMAPVVAAAEAYRDDGAVGAGIVPAVDAYRAKIRGTG